MNVVTINDNMCRVFEFALYVLIMPPSARDTITTMNWALVHHLSN